MFRMRLESATELKIPLDSFSISCIMVITLNKTGNKMTTPKIETPFEIIVGDPGGEILNGDVPVRWCVTPELVKNMEDDGIKDPHILIATWSDKAYPKIMQRQLVPLADLMTYARFTRAGECRIHAWIIDGSTGRKEINKRFIATGTDDFVAVLDYYNDPVTPPEVEEMYALASAHVIIPKGVFGKEPSRWLKWFVNLWHEKKVVDECHYRRRVIFAFTLKWIPVLAWIVSMISLRFTIATLFTLCGFRKLPKWKYVFKPWDATFNMAIPADEFDTNDQDYLFDRKVKVPSEYYDRYQTHFLMLPFTPIIPIVIWIVSWNVTGIFGMGALYAYWWMTILMFFTVAFDALGMFVNWFKYTTMFSDSVVRYKAVDLWIGENGYGPTLAGIMGIIAVSLFGWVAVNFTVTTAFVIGVIVTFFATTKAFDWYWDREIEHNDYSEIRELLCPNDKANLRPDYKLIPVKQRSIRLFFLNTKNKMCKPMQM